MLSDCNAVATVAVRDLDAARRFYEGKLGLKDDGTSPEGSANYKTGGSTLFVYVSSFAGTNQATGVTWPAGRELRSLVAALAAKGVAFEHYDMPGWTRDGDIHKAGPMEAAWFKDPDGNIHGMFDGTG